MGARKILVIEDDPNIQELLKVNLEQKNWSVDIAESGEVALLKMSDCHPNLILLDIMLPGIQGLELCQQLREYPKTSRVPIIMISALASSEDIINGLEQGADDYVTKPFDLNVLFARVDAVMRRKAEPCEESHEDVITVHDMIIDPVRHSVKVGKESVMLTPNEFSILQFLSSDPGRVFTRQQIIESGHEPGTDVTARSVDVQIVGLRKHLGRAGRYIETIRGIGYRLKECIN